MKIFALPGISQKTERWATNLLNEFASPDHTMTVQHYLHWDCDDSHCLSLDEEVERLRGCEIDLLVAKSLGVMIGLTACSREIITPRQIVCIGTPVIGFLEKNIDLRQLVTKLNTPCLFIQQAHDIVGSCASLREHISDIPQVDLVEIPGDNHQYKDLKLLARHIKKRL
jgi:hypothetical protein